MRVITVVAALSVFLSGCAGDKSDRAPGQGQSTDTLGGSLADLRVEGLSDAAISKQTTGIVLTGGTLGDDPDSLTSSLFFMDDRGSDLTRIGTSTDQDRHVALAPDDQLLVFGCGPMVRQAEICTMRPDGSRRTRLTRNRVEDAHPDISIDRWIVFQWFIRGSGDELFKIRADGSDVVRLTHNDVDERDPVWSPDGKWIAFSKEVALTEAGQTDYDLFIMSDDGQQTFGLTSGGSPDRAPDWSPDGRTIAFTRGQMWPEAGDIYTVNVDGSDLRRVAQRAVDPAWSDDGRQLLLFGTRNGELGIFRIRSDGSQLTRLLDDHFDRRGHCFPSAETNHVCYYSSPDW